MTGYKTMLFIDEESQNRGQVYVPAPSISSEINFRVDMKDGNWKLEGEAILDQETGNGTILTIYPLAMQEFYGDIGLSEGYDWTKLVFIPLTKHPLIQFSRLVACSVFFRGDAAKNFRLTKSQAPAKGISLSSSVIDCTFGRMEKSTADGQKVTTRPATFKVRSPKAKSDEETSIKIILKELPQLREAVESLVQFNSGKNIIMMHNDGQDEMRKAKFRGELPSGENGDIKALAGSVAPNYYLPESKDF